MEEFYNRLVEEYESFPSDAIMVLHLASPEFAAEVHKCPSSRADCEHAIDQLEAWHQRMKEVIEEEAEV